MGRGQSIILQGQGKLGFEILDALESLSIAHRDALVLVFYQGHSMAEAGAILGVPEGTVKSRCHYAMRSLIMAGWY